MMDKQRGVSIISILVAMVIGLLTIGAVITIYAQSIRHNSILRNTGLETQNKSRFLQDFTMNHVSLAGFNDTSVNDGNIVELAALSGTNGANDNSDTLVYRFKANDNSTFRNCLDQVVLNNIESVNTLNVQVSSKEYNTGLFCNDVELVNGVSRFDVLYAEDTTGDGSINRYVPAGTENLNFDQVIGLKFVFFVRVKQGIGEEIVKQFTTVVALRNV